MRYIINETAYGIQPEELFEVGKRYHNKKRGFLFISKLLGKHLEVHPEVVRSAGYLLSCLKYNYCLGGYYAQIVRGKEHHPVTYDPIAEDDQLVIGFAETATGLGMAVASSIKGCTYQTTTREDIRNMPSILSFEEEHSHATTHRMFSRDVDLSAFSKVTLVDDEITTGKSLLNLMAAIESVSHMREYNIMTILDWMDEEQWMAFKRFSEEHDSHVNIYHVASGSILDGGNDEGEDDMELTILPSSILPIPIGKFRRKYVNIGTCRVPALSDTGRFGTCYENILSVEKQAYETAEMIADEINMQVDSGKILVVGHGENIYIPSRIATNLAMFGVSTDFKTTTRSPIAVDGEIIRDVATFSYFGEDYYYYNLCNLKDYDRIVFISEYGNVPVLRDDQYVFLV